jgi:integrase
LATVVNKPKNAKKPWAVRYQVAGKQRERSFTTKKEADDYKAKYEYENRQHIFTDPKAGASFVEAAEAYIDRLDCAANTRRGYRSRLRKHIAPAMGDRKLGAVAMDRNGVRDLIASTPFGVRHIVATVIIGTVTDAVASGKITSHRLDGITVRRRQAKPAEIIPVSREQLEGIALGMHPGLELSVFLMRGCGLRISEAMAVKLSGFRMNGKILRITEQIERVGYLPLKGRREGDYRDVPVPGWLWPKVQQHVSEYGTQDSGYLFPHVGYNVVAQPMMRAAAAMGSTSSPRIRRHQFASTMLAAGLPITTVADWLGHRDVNVTFRVYSHLLPDVWEQGREALEVA